MYLIHICRRSSYLRTPVSLFLWEVPIRGTVSWTAGLASETSLEDKPIFNIPSELMQILILERSELLLSMTPQVQTAVFIHLLSKLDNRVIRNAQVDPWDAKHTTPYCHYTSPALSPPNDQSQLPLPDGYFSSSLIVLWHEDSKYSGGSTA